MNQNLIAPGTLIIPHVVLMSDETKNELGNKNKSLSVSGLSHKGHTTIMLVDDDIDDREMFAEAAEELNMDLTVTCIERGRDLMKVLNDPARLVPDVIFLDLNMPDKTGRECLNEIRSSHQFKDIPVVIYSTSASQRDIDDTFNQGANLYVRKPAHFSDLKKIIATLSALNWEEHRPLMLRSRYLFSLT